MSQLSMEELFEGAPFLVVASPAKTSAKRASKKGCPASVRASGLKCLELLSKQDPLGSLLKTLVLSSEWGSTLVSLAWRPRATPQGRLYFHLVASARSTGESDASLLPTARANKVSGYCSPGYGPSLEQAVKAQLLPTARANQAMAATINPDAKFPNLETVIAREMLLTPTANDSKLCDPENYEKYLSQNKTAGARLRGQVPYLLATRTDIHQYKAATGERGVLNPSFVEMLMGFPIGWTDLEP